MARFTVEYVRSNPLSQQYSRAETELSEGSAIERMRALTSDPQVLSVVVYREEGRRRTTLASWSRNPAGNCRTARQTTLFPPQPCGGSTPPAGGNAGL